MSRLPFAVLSLGLAVVALPVEGSSISYSFTKIVDNTNGFTPFGADINDSGTVAVNTNQGVYIFSGGVLTPTGFSSGWWPTINNQGDVAFLSSIGESVVVTPFGIVGSANNVDVAVNDNLDVAYISGADLYLQSLSGSGTPIILADTSGQFSQIGPGPALNNSGQVAFDATLQGGVTGVFRASAGGPTTTIALADGVVLSGFEQSPSINGSGTVAFSAATPAGRVILTGSGGALTTIATSCAGGCAFSDLGRSPDINDGGVVVFDADLTTPCGPVATCSGVFTSSSGGLSTVIQSGDSLFGSTVAAIGSGNAETFDRPRINDAGQIVFGYELSDGEFGIAVATPQSNTPEPATWAVSLIAVLGCILMRRHTWAR